jgi:hypothetical protein
VVPRFPEDGAVSQPPSADLGATQEDAPRTGADQGLLVRTDAELAPPENPRQRDHRPGLSRPLADWVPVIYFFGVRDGTAALASMAMATDGRGRI